MDQRLDRLARSLAHTTSRRGALKVLAGAALGGLGVLGSRQRTAAQGGGNSACAQWCHDHFTGAAAGHCTADAAQHTGLCFQCGPAAPAGSGVLCSQTCCASGQSCVSGICLATCSSEGEMRCQGTGFVTCEHGVEIFRDCAPGTVCRPFAGSILCDIP